MDRSESSRAIREQAERGGNAKFIVIEGIDGSGSTSQGQDVTNYFRGQGRQTVFTWEPTTGPVGMLIRLALTGRLKGYVENGLRNQDDDEVAKMSTDLDPYTMALLFAADRRDHIAAEIQPNLARGRTVISDRYLLSSLAYQGLSADIEWLLQINETAIQPDLTIYLDVPAERARQRIQGTRWTEDIYESVVQQRLVREKYHEIIAQEIPLLGQIVKVDASGSKDGVQSELRRLLTLFFETGVIDEPQHDFGLFG